MVTAKAIKAANALTAIAKNTWGIGHRAARMIYLGAIEPIILYAAPIWAEACSRTYICKKLSKAQRIAALRICRAYRTAPTSALLVLGALIPIHIKAMMYSNNWKTINLFDSTNPTSQKNREIISHFPNQIRKDILRYDLEQLNIDSNIEQVYPSLNNTPHQDHRDISIYTDGSKLDNQVGAAFVLFDHAKGSTHRSAFKLGPHCSVPQAEILGLTKAIEYLHSDWFPSQQNIDIFTDSTTALYSLFNLGNRDSNILKAHNIIANSHHDHNITFSWVRGHSNNTGNDAADVMAKKAARSQLDFAYTKIPKSTIKNWNYQHAIQQWQEEWNGSLTGRLTFKFISDINRRLQMKHFTPSFPMTQLLTGHGNLNAYLNRFHLQNSEACSCDSIS
ncbi:uncharacterized protein [Centruroides vittatus]|uniref:uncharacterized protein n=1 Tax=Centruroides vittatus TaxID=120091 RepID=UPI00350F9512